MTNISKKSKSDKVIPHRLERGGILIEFALVLPVILAIFTGFTDLGMMLDQRARLERAVYEAVKYGISVPGLEPVSYNSSQPNTSYPRQLDLQKRLVSILAQNNFTSSAVLTSKLEPTGTGNNRSGILTVTVQAQVPAELPGFKSYSLSITQSAPYLFRF